ncbi:RagB/SusD family nutrient uptake outer membrane protein [Longitalea arenae]|uniref:RagB/SusD family nutrient uptake outer membrane protein n=1 Tax=Longitalea arenae TaxID=2812558 RepID=UPI001966D256|nr:RagB/SusD family nutrient uptake outer membrane protein [Longitalea arenae]
MKQIAYSVGWGMILLCSACTRFLKEEPDGFLTTDKYYTTESQVKAAVNGAYAGLDDIFATGIGVATSPAFVPEYLTGYSTRLRPGDGDAENQFLRLDYIDPANGRLEPWWTAIYYPVENCNSVLDNLSRTSFLPAGAQKQYMGEVYFLRAWYYFQGVRLFGDIPLKTTPTTDLSNTRIPKAPQEKIYDQIVADLLMAEQAGLPWTDISGHVSQGAVKSLLAKVYITMAGYPLQKGNDYYRKAYEKAKEVIDSKAFALFPRYSDLRQASLQNTGEFIFMLQRDPVNAGNFIHFYLMPFPELPISIQPTYGGALAPHIAFYNAFAANDQRKQEQAFFYTRSLQYNDPSNMVNLPGPLIYKYWDDEAEKTGKAGQNFCYLRFADVLLLCAEARANIDGGSTSDATAIDAYYQVRRRAFPAASKPAAIHVDEVLKERFFELCFEWQTWYDMLRTRRTLNLADGQMVNLIGYKAPTHLKAFAETDLLLPVPLSEVQKNPLLK